MAAVRVPPSACRTSQSTVRVRLAIALRSITARRLRPIRRWISELRPDGRPLLTSRRDRAVGGARQHGVLGGDPALAAVDEPARHLFLDAGRHQHAGVAHLDQRRALGELHRPGGDADGAELVLGPFVDAPYGVVVGHRRHCSPPPGSADRARPSPPARAKPPHSPRIRRARSPNLSRAVGDAEMVLGRSRRVAAAVRRGPAPPYPPPPPPNPPAAPPRRPPAGSAARAADSGCSPEPVCRSRWSSSGSR